jgi:hypothetical protein
MGRQIGVEVEFEILPDQQEPVCPVPQQLGQIGDRDLDDLRTLAPHLFDCSAHDRGHFGVRRVRAEQGSQEADAGAAQGGQLQVIGVALRDIADAR